MNDKKLLSMNEGIDIVLTFLEEHSASTKTINDYGRSYRQLKKYLEANGLVYTNDNALEWLEQQSKRYSDCTYMILKRAINRLDDACNSRPMNIERSIYGFTGPYKRLSDWAKNELHEYLSSMPGCERTRYLHQNCISHFLDFAIKNNVCSIDEIKPETIKKYRDSLVNCKTRTRSLRIGKTAIFLRYEAQMGKLSPALWMLMIDRFANEAVLYDPLANEKEYESTLNVFQYLELVDEFLQDETILAFADTVKSLTFKTLQSHFLFLTLNNLSYSIEQADDWIFAHSAFFKAQLRAKRHALHLFEHYRLTGNVDVTLALRPEFDLNRFPAWSVEIFQSLIYEKKREKMSESTLNSYRSVALRLFPFLDANGVHSPDQITPEVLTRFVLEDKHTTIGGKTCYIAKVRKIIEFMADEGLVEPTLVLALPTVTAPSVKVVEVLDDSDLEEIAEARKRATTPMELRDSAMVTIALYAGLRASDVVNLKFSDISWKDETISIVQKKTKKPITLPLTPEVGNSIFLYLQNGRPTSNSDYIFIKHHMPYDNVTRSACQKAVKKMTGNPCATAHMLRRTFATKMLQGGVGMEQIAEALGHSTNSNVKEYLSLDEKRMRMCALPLPQKEVHNG